MNFPSFPWLELTLLLPILGAMIVSFIRTPVLAARWCIGFLLITLIGTTAAAFSYTKSGSLVQSGAFAVDNLSGPMLPVMSLLHLLTMLGTAKSRVSPPFCVRLLLAKGITLAALTCHIGSVLVALLVLAVLLPVWDLKSRGLRSRGYWVYMALFIGLLLAGWNRLETSTPEWTVGLLVLAVLLRGGVVPLHGWLPTLFQGAAFGTAMLFVLPLMEVLASLRLLLPVAPDWMLKAAGTVCLVTAVYGGGMACVQHEVRRFYAHLALSQTSMVLFAVMLHTSNGLTAAMCLWISTTLSLAGLALSVRSLEARFGALSLREHHGYYEQVPGLAICFLITGLASVGFPGTIGFVPMELLISGSVDQGLGISLTLAFAAMLNGIAIMRAYFALFTGRRPTTSVSLQVTPTERLGIIIMALVVFLGGWFSPAVVASRHRVADELLQQRSGGALSDEPSAGKH
jgi:NADH:ubiquinone oxidoreductase subunit 4 (subunit M)